MLEELGTIQHPLLRSLTAAAVAGSAITMASAVVLGLTHQKNDSAYQAGVYSALLGAGGSALVGLMYPDQKKRRQSIPGKASSQPTKDGDWKDWRNFVVVRKVKESEEITSFYLRPEDNQTLPSFQPGQFLTIKLDIPGQPQPVIRTYSLSDYPDPWDHYRLSIKREPAPKGLAVPPGIASNFMHDHIQEGAVIPARPPSGRFVLDVQQSIPAVLISNGVGITPLISMAQAATRLNPQRPIWFVHGARDGRFHAFRDEILALAQANPNLRVHFAYSRPQPEDKGQYHSLGYVDTALIQSLVGQDAEYFLCGSPAFMQSLREGLQQVGVPEQQVFFESFMARREAMSKQPAAQSTATATMESEVVFAQSGQTFTWKSSDGSILEFAEANGLTPAFSCRQGICGTCMCKLQAGEVDYQEPPTAAIAAGSVLICIAQPKTAQVVLDL